jgi:hypothetical protein
MIDAVERWPPLEKVRKTPFSSRPAVEAAIRSHGTRIASRRTVCRDRFLQAIASPSFHGADRATNVAPGHERHGRDPREDPSCLRSQLKGLRLTPHQIDDEHVAGPLGPSSQTRRLSVHMVWFGRDPCRCDSMFVLLRA